VTVIARIALLAVALGACARPRVAAVPPVDAAARAPDDPEAPYRCARDQDCVVSCRFGAVATVWWRAHGADDDRGCQDGCASKGLVAVCERGSCATDDTRFGKRQRVPECTRRAP
jgi:hypothetical protein